MSDFAKAVGDSHGQNFKMELKRRDGPLLLSTFYSVLLAFVALSTAVRMPYWFFILLLETH